MEEHNEIMEESVPEERDFDTEVRALFEARPELRGGELPREVLMACVDGKRLTDAYNDYAKAQRQENRVLQQNAQAAAQAPVRGVTRGGGTNTKPEDAFLKGFNSSW